MGKKDKTNWQKRRLKGKEIRRTLIDAIRDYLERNNLMDCTGNWMYLSTTEEINKGLFGRTSSQLKDDWETENPRDAMTEDELDHVRIVEELTVRLIDNDNMLPKLAAMEALKRLIIPVYYRVKQTQPPPQ